MKDTKQIAILCFLSDVGISLWSYFKFTNYDEYLKLVKPITTSPDLQTQIYQILLQSFTFTLLLFLSFHLIIYILLWKKKVYAIKYIRFYTFMAAISAVLLVASSFNNIVAIIPLIVYVMSFKALGKILKEETDIKQAAEVKS
jgi:hypothetical protein